MIGKKTWLIPDGYMASTKNGDYVSHEAVCVLNVSNEDARIMLTVYFEDREPMAGFAALCPARRTSHVRLDKLTNADGVAIPRDVPYALLVTSDIPVVVQHSRMDVTQAEMALMTSVPFSE